MSRVVREIVRCRDGGAVARGLTNRQIANTLVISEHTAANHVDHIMRWLGFCSRAQIAAWAAAQGQAGAAE